MTRERSFTADASHQLRTPLAALRLELETLQLRSGDAPELTAALAQVDRLKTTIDTLLAVARDAPRGGGQADLSALLDDAESRWRGPLAADSRPFRTHVSPGPSVTAGAAPEVAREILDVLIGNAHAHGRGGVDVSVSEIEGWPAIEVADEGPGFSGDPEDAFARRPGEGSGHGIGLSLARSLATAEGGRLTVVRPGPGPVVRLMLPPALPDRDELP
ncbi:MAG: hypothetical protein QOI11_2469 [Candidatus Eremiobacteraeota bacterium]|nr:hypothetical protein [Candidatus Eremiobacteraeota bacterium]